MMTDDRMTLEEFKAMFGDAIPLWALQYVWTCDPTLTVAEVRKELERRALESRADELIGCTEGSKEEEELKAISEVLEGSDGSC